MSKYYGWWLPADISTHGAAIDKLIVVVHIFMAVLFVGWFFFFIYLLLRFRQSASSKAEHHTGHFKLPTFLEVGVAVFEVILLTAFSFPIWHQYRQEPPDESRAMHIHVIAEQFAWNIHYPGPDGKFGRREPKLVTPENPTGLDATDPSAKDDVTTINQLHIPVHTPVIVHLSSKDVIHSFFLPVMRIKQDMVPGQSIPVWFEAKSEGDFEIACAQLCGLGHYRMKGYFSVETKDKFDAWFADQEKQKATS